MNSHFPWHRFGSVGSIANILQNEIKRHKAHPNISVGDVAGVILVSIVWFDSGFAKISSMRMRFITCRCLPIFGRPIWKSANRNKHQKTRIAPQSFSVSRHESVYSLSFCH